MNVARDIVVVGAGQGSLTAMANIAPAWPKESPPAAVVALAVPGQPPEMLLQIVASYSHVKITYAVHGEPLIPGRVYLSPLGKHIAIGTDGALRLDDGNAFDSTRPSINRLFASAAAVYGDRVIGILLSGRKKDGSQGLIDIEKAGGVGVVQDPDDAIESLTPRGALYKGHKHFCVRAADIGPLVHKLMRPAGSRADS